MRASGPRAALWHTHVRLHDSQHTPAPTPRRDERDASAPRDASTELASTERASIGAASTTASSTRASPRESPSTDSSTRTRSPITLSASRDASLGAAEPLSSLAVLRGAVLAAFVVVEVSSALPSSFAQLRAAEWHGATFADFTSVALVFVVGATVASRMRTHAAEPTHPGDSQGARVGLARMLGISAALVALGVLLNGVPDFDPRTWRYAGLLQRIGLCCAFAALTWRVLRPAPRAVLECALLLVYHALLVLGSSGAARRGDLSPGGCVGAALDQAVLGRAHILGQGCVDPDGIASTLGAFATVLIGLRFGALARANAERAEFARQLSITGALHVVAGWAWSFALPWNRALWTPSLAVAAAGACLLAWAAFDVLAREERHGDRWLRGHACAELARFGERALLVYVACELAVRLLPRLVGAADAHSMSRGNAPLGSALTWIAAGLETRAGSLALALALLGACFALTRAAARR